jgi:hypothetical protein
MKNNHKNWKNNAKFTGTSGPAIKGVPRKVNILAESLGRTSSPDRYKQIHDPESCRTSSPDRYKQIHDPESCRTLSTNRHMQIHDADKKTTISLHFKNAAAIWLDMRDAQRGIREMEKGRHLWFIPGIYLITNKINKKHYVGKSSYLCTRVGNYKNYLERYQKGSKICHILNKLGWENFSLTILERVEDDLDKLGEREQYYIDLFKPFYNIRSKVNNPLTKKGKKQPTIKESGKTNNIKEILQEPEV